ncbi:MULTISPECIES: high-affinity branched-chain amino acid ABC transporter permease LivM [unclassified Shinella]|uniref:high-affinity branched-chain amino acid ABC transporter permease LivM n=1 Tax=unclassified Shinella TaxID=2643062 RepID=UPI00225CAD7C|nr:MULTISPECIES: high-affinity branched-chain amino acid ABC transporter permease LivM [unclassified Shinella]MCO5139132.1 high-affinity branched-chain amino acid ABC transporter permease LivM [Shinella sp.]MDC7256138.1 high-affinity branched-chain amino acid ABC transporter permease LivM [Shinella sp. YE25]CAI0338980.1 High-affinity branched-chain amino acid transport system permease protein BraE [Rhizobiaceae bacterium]CAK7257404.1 High-affinity branched-chain amino acid transport system perm
MSNISNTHERAGGNLTAQALREGFFAGLVALGLFVLFVGLETTQNIRNELVLNQRWGLLTIFVIVAAVGRFLSVAYLRPWLAARKAAAAAKPAEGEESFFKRNFSKIAIVALIFYPPIMVMLFGVQGSLKWVDNFGIQILIYVMLAWGLNIVVGLAGLLDLGYVAFYAVGAYSYALLSQQFGFSFWILLPLAGILAAFWGMILGFPVLRLKGDYLAIVTLAFGEIIRLVLINWTEVTRGTFGVSGIPKASVFGIWSFDVSAPNNFAKAFDLPMSSAYYKIFLFYLILALALLTAYVTIRLRRMPIGRAWEALREDEIACRSLGINTVTTKLTAFSIGAMFGGFAGSFFAVRQGFVSPESFVFLESAIILAIVVLGGMGSLVGIAVAAAVMVGGTELLREMTFLKQIFGPDFTPELYRMLIFGLAMVTVMVWKPRGFVGSREPTAFLRERKAVSGSFTKEGHG